MIPSQSQADLGPAANRAVGLWLLVVCGFVAAMILVGGATRLTDSGLSITEWDLAKGLVPPLTDAGWQTEFGLYQQTTEYQTVNRGMSPAEFQFIYWWEWGHRFLGKMIGLVFAVPFFWFLARGQLKGRVGVCTLLLGLGGLQGAIGWWMVTSGLTGRVDVAPYRLATHLGMAFLILTIAFPTALSALGVRARAGQGDLGRGPVMALCAVVFGQILLGALVAGTRAGAAYTDWPTIGGEWFPASWNALTPFWHNLTENQALVQFNHRTFGYLVALFGLWVAHRAMAGTPAQRRLGLALALAVLAQAGLGIVTVISGAPLALGLIHQFGAVVLWLIVLALLSVTARYPDTASQSHGAQVLAKAD